MDFSTVNNSEVHSIYDSLSEDIPCWNEIEVDETSWEIQLQIPALDTRCGR